MRNENFYRCESFLKGESLFISISMKNITWFFTFSFIVLLQKFQRTYRQPNQKVGFHWKFYFGLRKNSYKWGTFLTLESVHFFYHQQHFFDSPCVFYSPTLKVHNAPTLIHNPIFVTLFIVICTFCSIKNLIGVSLFLKVRVCLFPFLWKTLLDFSPFSFIVLLQKFQRTYRQPHKKVGFHWKFYFGLRKNS